MKSLDLLDFDNRFATLPETFHTRIAPTPVPAPYLVACNPDALELLGLPPAAADSNEFIEVFSGNAIPSGADPLAALYAGHQFGHYVPQLGDGRAILLGEVLHPSGTRWEVQLKGAGRTPYSRGGDGRAVLRSSIREYLCSEAMHGLGIPSTRALCITGSDMPVQRETTETCAIVTRCAPSFIRFGSFEVFYYRSRHDEIKTLADFTLAHHFPELFDEPRPHAALLREVTARTAKLMAQWQAVGFCHGVMNTDNMSILGLTLDYGPYGFMEAYDPGWICNHSDHDGRYAYDRQPQIGAWNCTCLAQALLPLVELDEAREALSGYGETFSTEYMRLMCAKLGLPFEEDSAPLVAGLVELMARNRTDYTLLFRALAGFDSGAGAKNAGLRDLFITREDFDAWAKAYGERLRTLGSVDAERAERMKAVNPKYVLRNYLAETAIRKARDERDFGEIERLRRLLARPFDEQPEFEDYAKEPPDWAKEIAVSCSS
ncbi:MAG: protein adenylyltransferase SelO [Pseudomonadota bacterium]